MRYILFAKKTCPFCIKAETLLKENNLLYNVVNFESNQEGVLSEIKKAHNWNTVPMIFERNEADIKFIGGFTDLQKWLERV